MFAAEMWLFEPMCGVYPFITANPPPLASTRGQVRPNRPEEKKHFQGEPGSNRWEETGRTGGCATTRCTKAAMIWWFLFFRCHRKVIKIAQHFSNHWLGRGQRVAYPSFHSVRNTWQSKRPRQRQTRTADGMIGSSETNFRRKQDNHVQFLQCVVSVWFLVLQRVVSLPRKKWHINFWGKWLMGGLGTS